MVGVGVWVVDQPQLLRLVQAGSEVVGVVETGAFLPLELMIGLVGSVITWVVMFPWRLVVGELLHPLVCW